MKYSLHIMLGAALIAFFSCRGGSGEGSASMETGDETAMSGQIVITKDQFKEAGMVVGDPPREMFSNEVHANGFVVAAIGGSARINTLVPGRVRRIYHAEGETVGKGDILFSLESNDFIMLQQEYAEVHQQVQLLKADYQRQKALFEERILAEKDFLRTESDYRRMLSKKEGLGARLRMIHVDPKEIESGTILPFLTVRSPIPGTITHQELVLGQFLDPQTTVMEVVDDRKLQLSLRVFEQSLEEVAIGQVVQFNTPDHPETIYEGILSHVGKSIDPDTKTVHCIARLDPEMGESFVNNLFVETRIITCKREVVAVPENAIIKEPDYDFVWTLLDETEEEFVFRKIPVQTGVTRGGYTEVLDEDLSSVLLVGAYNLWTED
jgi:cobalt-zinc-cadmium efflux system membrane fusion protein